MGNEKYASLQEVPCCPALDAKPTCDTMDLRFQLPVRTVVNNNKDRVTVDLILHFRLERCSGDLVLGEPVYSTTLLPGEKVRLFTSDRHSRWSYDSETDLSYRHETTSEESFYSAGMSKAIADLAISENVNTSSSYEESTAEGGGGASLNLGFVKIGGGGGASSYDASSTYDFSRSLSQHAEAASSYVAASVRAKSAVAIGEVSNRAHAEGESEAHYESSTRVISNPNRCRAVTYLFHRINKTQTVKFRLVAIERRVSDPAAPTTAYQREVLDHSGGLKIQPNKILASHSNRLELERNARASVFDLDDLKASGFSNNRFVSSVRINQDPINVNTRRAALAAVDRDLIKEGLLDEKTGKPTDKVIAELSWERVEILPTPGVMVRGCLDSCQTCEPQLEKQISLELERMELENALLKRQVELLHESQEYRCCPESDRDGNGETSSDNLPN